MDLVLAVKPGVAAGNSGGEAEEERGAASDLPPLPDRDCQERREQQDRAAPAPQGAVRLHQAGGRQGR